MKHTLAFLPFLILSYATGFAQSSTGWMGELDSMILKSQALVYSKPAGFAEVGKTVCFDTYEMYQRIGKCVGNQLHADDGEFIAFIHAHRALPEQELARINQLFAQENSDYNSAHIRPIRNSIQATLGDEAAANWKKHVHYYSPKETKHKFNADTAIRYSIPMPPDQPYEGKYSNLQVLVLQKHGKNYISIYCLYTDKAKKRLRKYWRAVEGVLRYDDCDPCPEVDFSTLAPVTINLDELAP